MDLLSGTRDLDRILARCGYDDLVPVALQDLFFGERDNRLILHQENHFLIWFGHWRSVPQTVGADNDEIAILSTSLA